MTLDYCEYCKRHSHNDVQFVKLIRKFNEPPFTIGMCKNCRSQKEFYYVDNEGYIKFNEVKVTYISTYISDIE